MLRLGNNSSQHFNQVNFLEYIARIFKFKKFSWREIARILWCSRWTLSILLLYFAHSN